MTHETCGPTCEWCGSTNTQVTSSQAIPDLEAIQDNLECMELECGQEFNIWR